MWRLFVMIGAVSCIVACSPSKKLPKTGDNLPRPEKRMLNPESTMLLVEAGKQRMLGKADSAIRLYLRALEADPNNDAAHYELTKIYNEKQQLDDALLHAEMAIKIDNTNPWYLQQYARLLTEQGQFDEGVAASEQLVALFPKNVDYLYNLAQTYQFAEQHENALKTYDDIEKIVGFDQRVSLEKQQLYTELGQIENSAAEIKKLIQNNPEDERFIGFLAEYYQNQGYIDSAQVYYGKLLALSPDQPQTLVAQLDLAAQQNDAAAFSKALANILNNEPFTLDDKISVLYPYIDTVANRNNALTPTCLNASKQLTTQYPEEAKAFAFYGDFLYNAHNPEQAVAAYEQSVALQNDVYDVWEQLLFIHSNLQDYDRLIDVADRASKIFPDKGLPFYMAGFGHYQKKQYNPAVDVLTKGATISEVSPRIKAEMHSLLGDSYHNLKEYELSDKNYDKALLYDPDNAYVLNNYSYYLTLREKDLDRAEKMISRAVQLLPDNPAMLDTYAWVLFKKKAYEQALPYIKKAVHLSNDSATLADHYGDILFMLGKKNDAVKSWKRARLLGKKSDVLDRKIQQKQYFIE